VTGPQSPYANIPSPLRERARVRVAQKLPLILTFSPKGEKEFTVPVDSRLRGNDRS